MSFLFLGTSQFFCAVCVCGSPPLLQATWFEYAAGAEKVPCGAVCEHCGITAECWPLLTKAQVAEQFQASSSFRVEFQTTRKGVVAAVRSQWRKQQVVSQKMISLKLLKRVCFVEVDVFKATTGCSALEVGLKTIHVPGLDGQPLEGVLLASGSVPEEVPHYLLECSGGSERILCDYLLDGADRHRKEQPAERYTLACKNMKQDVLVKSLVGLPQYKTVAAKSQQIQQDRLSSTLAGVAAATGPSEVSVESRTRLDDESGFMKPPPKAVAKAKAHTGKGKGAGKGAGGNRGRGASPASSFSSRSAQSHRSGGSSVRGLSESSAPPSVGSAAPSGMSTFGVEPELGVDAASVTGDAAPASDTDIKSVTLMVLLGWNNGRELKRVWALGLSKSSHPFF